MAVAADSHRIPPPPPAASDRTCNTAPRSAEKLSLLYTAFIHFCMSMIAYFFEFVNVRV